MVDVAQMFLKNAFICDDEFASCSQLSCNLHGINRFVVVQPFV